MEVIRTKNLTKSFGDVLAVDDVSLNVEEGEIYGFLGLNGAGKTTTIRLLLGMIKQNSGSKKLFGKKIDRSTSVWNDVGYLVETPHSYPDLTVTENLELIRRYRKLPDSKPVNEIILKLNLTEYKNRKARHLSLGNNQRLGLAKALIHNPKLLILDEPINGLDPAGIVEIRELLTDLAHNHNTTIFLSSHILSEISKLAARIGIVHKGKLIKELAADQLESQIIKKLIVGANDNNAAYSFLKEHGINVHLNNSELLEITDQKFLKQPELISVMLVNANLPPAKLNIVEEDLETYFLRIIREEAG